MDLKEITRRIWTELLGHVMVTQDASCEFNTRELAIHIVSSIIPYGAEAEQFDGQTWLEVHTELLDIIKEQFDPKFIDQEPVYRCYELGDGQRMIVMVEHDGQYGLWFRMLYVRARPVNMQPVFRHLAEQVLSSPMESPSMYAWAESFAERVIAAQENSDDDPT